MSSCRCPDEFTHSTSIIQLHRFGKILLDVRVGVANCPALNFLSQVGSEGNGVGLSSVVVKLRIQDERYLSHILSMKVVVEIFV